MSGKVRGRETGRAVAVTILDGSGDSAMDAANDALRVNIVAGSAGATEYTEDAAAAANPVGSAINLIRADTLAALVTANGDNVAQRGTDYGEAYVATGDVTATGNITALNGTVQIALGGRAGVSATISGTHSATFVGEVSGDGGTTWELVDLFDRSVGSVGFAMAANGLYSITWTGGGISHARIRANGYTSGTIVVNLRATTAATELEQNFTIAPDNAIPANAVLIGGYDGALLRVPRCYDSDTAGGTQFNLGVELRYPASGGSITAATGGGTEATSLRVTMANDSTGVLSIDDNGGSLTVDGSIATQGTVADDATTPGPPVMIGGQAKSPNGTDPGSVSAENDVARCLTDLNRRLLVNDGHPNHWSFHENSSVALTDREVKAAPGAGLQIVITEIDFSTQGATAATIFFEEATTTILGPWGLEAVAGRGLFWRGRKYVTANTALTVTTTGAVVHGLDVRGYLQAV